MAEHLLTAKNILGQELDVSNSVLFRIVKSSLSSPEDTKSLSNRDTRDHTNKHAFSVTQQEVGTLSCKSFLFSEVH